MSVKPKEVVPGGTSRHHAAGLALSLLPASCWQYLLDLQVSGVATKTESPWHAHSSPWARATIPVAAPAGSVRSCVLRNKISVIELFAAASPPSAQAAEPAGSRARRQLAQGKARSSTDTGAAVRRDTIGNKEGGMDAMPRLCFALPAADKAKMCCNQQLIFTELF